MKLNQYVVTTLITLCLLSFPLSALKIETAELPSDLYRGQIYEGIVANDEIKQTSGELCSLTAFFKDQSILKGPRLAKNWDVYGFSFEPNILYFQTGKLSSSITYKSKFPVSNKMYTESGGRIFLSSDVMINQNPHRGHFSLEYNFIPSRLKIVSVKTNGSTIICKNLKRVDAAYQLPLYDPFKITEPEYDEIKQIRKNRKAIGFLTPYNARPYNAGSGYQKCRSELRETTFTKIEGHQWSITFDQFSRDRLILAEHSFLGGWHAKNARLAAASAANQGPVTDEELQFVQSILARQNAQNSGVVRIVVTERAKCHKGYVTDGYITDRQGRLVTRTRIALRRN